MTAFAWASEAMVDLKLEHVFMEVSTEIVQQVLNQPESFMYSRECVQRSNVVFLRLGASSLHTVPRTCNSLAMEISESVTMDQRSQSYVATFGPACLKARIRHEASTTVPA